jgi:hypothetical protein
MGTGGAAAGADRCSDRLATATPTATTRIATNTTIRIRPERAVAGWTRGAASDSATGARWRDGSLI